MCEEHELSQGPQLLVHRCGAERRQELTEGADAEALENRVAGRGSDGIPSQERVREDVFIREDQRGMFISRIGV